MWLNLLFLLTVAFMPFPAALLGRRTDDDAFPAVFYAVGMTLASALSLLPAATMWLVLLPVARILVQRAHHDPARTR